MKSLINTVNPHLLHSYPFLIGLFCIMLSSCATSVKVQNPYGHIGDQQVVEILQKSFSTLGGLDNWQNKKTLKYRKHTTLYLESGAVERDIKQQHDYVYQPKKEINISWKNSKGQEERVTATDEKIAKYIDNKEDLTAKESALQTSLVTSLFVVGVPFKMLDKGVELSYAGSDKLEDGQVVEVVKAVYNPSTNAHHTTPDTWWYYFDKNDYRLVGYMVKHDDHYSYVKNMEYAKVGSFIFPAKRESYRISSKREILYLRAKYTYEDWSVL